MRKILHLYMWSTLIVVIIGVTLGFIVPPLLSSNDNFFVALGVGLILTMPPLIGVLSWHAYTKLTEKK